MLSLRPEVAINELKTKSLLAALQNCQTNAESAPIKAVAIELLNYIQDDAKAWFANQKNSNLLIKYFSSSCIKLIPNLQTMLANNASPLEIIQTLHRFANQLKEWLYQVNPLHMAWLSHFSERSKTLTTQYDQIEREYFLHTHFLENLTQQFYELFSKNKKLYPVNLEANAIIPCKKTACIALFNNVFAILLTHETTRLDKLKKDFRQAIENLNLTDAVTGDHLFKSPRLLAYEYASEDNVNNERAKSVYDAFLNTAKAIIKLQKKKPKQTDFFRPKPTEQKQKKSLPLKRGLSFP